MSKSTDKIPEGRVEQNQTDQELQHLRNKLEAAEQRSEKLAVELDQLTYAISHDLRAPLRAINGFSEMLLDDYSERLDDEGKRYLQVVRNNSSKLNSYIEALLELTRIGRREINFAELDMTGLFTSVCQQFTANDREHRINFQIGDLPPARGDYEMIRDLITELIENAVRLTSSRRMAIIRVTGEKIGKENRYLVNDNGIGFDMQYSDKLFAMFQKLHGQESTERSGSGLALVRRIVERHGGEIRGEGRVDEGATFFFTLPAGNHAPGQG